MQALTTLACLNLFQSCSFIVCERRMTPFCPVKAAVPLHLSNQGDVGTRALQRHWPYLFPLGSILGNFTINNRNWLAGQVYQMVRYLEGFLWIGVGLFIIGQEQSSHCVVCCFLKQGRSRPNNVFDQIVSYNEISRPPVVKSTNQNLKHYIHGTNHRIWAIRLQEIL